VLILFDHGTPKGLIRALPKHTIHTPESRGENMLSNGALDAAEEAGFEVLLTTDRRIRYQQNLRARRIRRRVFRRAAQVFMRPRACGADCGRNHRSYVGLR
jgi:hypothetical protein